MTVLAGLAVPGARPFVVLASDSSLRSSDPSDPIPPAAEARVRNKLYALSDRHPIAAAIAGPNGLGRWPVVRGWIPDIMGATREAVDADPTPTVERAARALSARIWAEFGPYWRPEDAMAGCSLGYVCGFDPGRREPRCVRFALLPGEGLKEFRQLAVKRPALVFVSPPADQAGEAARAITVAPRSSEHGASILRHVIGCQIAHSARYPSPDFSAAGPVHTLALTPDSTPLAIEAVAC